MKKLIIFVSACILSVSAFAQGQGKKQGQKNPQEKIERQTKKLTDSLALTPDQATKLKALLLKRHSEMDSLRTKKANGADKNEIKSERKEIKLSADAEMKAILTPEQYAKLQAMREERNDGKKEEGKAKHEGHKHEGEKQGHGKGKGKRK